ncbi:MAG: hypothetical protein WC254_04675 [Candidatus Woesearchaeota archaeon]|jgi:hypothetical protein
MNRNEEIAGKLESFLDFLERIQSVPRNRNEIDKLITDMDTWYPYAGSQGCNALEITVRFGEYAPASLVNPERNYLDPRTYFSTHQIVVSPGTVMSVVQPFELVNRFYPHFFGVEILHNKGIDDSSVIGFSLDIDEINPPYKLLTPRRLIFSISEVTSLVPCYADASELRQYSFKRK